MKRIVIGGALLAVAAFAGGAAAQTLKGPVSDRPLTEEWAPSKWGAQDRAGSANHTNNPAHVARATAGATTASRA